MTAGGCAPQVKKDMLAKWEAGEPLPIDGTLKVEIVAPPVVKRAQDADGGTPCLTSRLLLVRC